MKLNKKTGPEGSEKKSSDRVKHYDSVLVDLKLNTNAVIRRYGVSRLTAASLKLFYFICFCFI